MEINEHQDIHTQQIGVGGERCENSSVLVGSPKNMIGPGEIDSRSDSFSDQGLGPILMPFATLDDPNFDFSNFIDQDTPLLISVKEKGWQSDVFQTYMDLDISDVAGVAADNPSHQFQSLDCTQPWTDYLSQTLGPNIWGPGDVYTLDTSKEIPQHIPKQLSTKQAVPTVATQITQQHSQLQQQQQQQQQPSQSSQQQQLIQQSSLQSHQGLESQITQTITNDTETDAQIQIIRKIGTTSKDSEEAEKNLKSTFSPKVLTGGAPSIQSFLQFLSNDDCCSVRYVMFAHGRVGEKDSSVLNWVIMCGKCKAKMDELIKRYKSLQEIPLSEIKNGGITEFRVEQWEGDLLVLPPNSVCQAATLNGHVVVVSWLRQVPRTLSLLYDKYVLPNFQDPNSSNSIAVPVKFSIARALSERIKREPPETECSDVAKQDIEVLLRMLKGIVFEERISDKDTHPTKRQRLRESAQSEDDMLMVPYEETSRFPVCSLCKGYILSYFFVCQMCGASQDSKTGLYCPSCVCESFHCGHTESFLLCKTICTIEYLENILAKAKERFPTIDSHVGSVDDSVLSYMTIAYSMLSGAKGDIHATCHQCKLSKTLDKLAFCTSLHQDTRKKRVNDMSITETAVVMKSCTKKYCISCLWNRYMIRISDCMRYRSWKCPFCKGECNCSACLKKKGVDPTNLEIPFTSKNVIGQTHKQPRPRIRRKTKSTAEDDMQEKDKEDGNSIIPVMFRSIGSITKRTVLIEDTQKRESPFCVTVGNLRAVSARDLTQSELTNYGLRDLDKSYIPVFLIREGIVTLVKPQMISPFSSVQVLQPQIQQTSFPQQQPQQIQQSHLNQFSQQSIQPQLSQQSIQSQLSQNSHLQPPPPPPPSTLPQSKSSSQQQQQSTQQQQTSFITQIQI